MNSRWLLAAAFFAALGVPASAQTWNQTAAGMYAWNVNTNPPWSTGVFPNSPTAVASVNNNIAGNQTINLNQLIDLQTLNLGDSDATNTFTIAAGGGSLQFNGTAALNGTANSVNTISAPITLAAGAGLTITRTGAAGLLNITGGINTGTGAGQTLTFMTSGDSTGSTTLGINVSSAITGDGNVVKSGGNFINFTAANTYTGTTTINAGAIRLSGAGTLGTGNLILAGGQFFPGATFTRAVGTGAGEVQWTGNAALGAIGQNLTVNLGGAGALLTWGVGGFLTPTGELQLSTTTATSNGTVTFVNPIDLNGAVRTINIGDGPLVAIDAVLGGALSGGTGSGVTKTGGGTLRLDASPTYTGVTRIGSGVLALNAGVTIAGNVAVTAGAVFSPDPTTTYTASLGTGPGQIDLAPTPNTVGGGFGAVGGNTTVSLGGVGTPTPIVWDVTPNFVPTGQALLFSSGSSSGTVTFANPIDLNGAARTFQINNGTAAVDAVLSGVISGPTGVLAKTSTGGASGLELTGANTYGGGTTISGGFVRVSSDGANPGDPAPLGAVPAVAGTNITLINGGALQYGAAFTLHPNRQLGLGTSGGIDTNGNDIILPNKITGSSSTAVVNFIKSGAGTLTLTAPAGTNDFSSTFTVPLPTAGNIIQTAAFTTVAGGALAIGATNTLPTTAGITLGAGTSVGNLDLSTFDQTVAALTAVSDHATAINTITIGSGRTLSVVNAAAPVGADTINQVPFVALNNHPLGAANSRTNVTFTGGGALVVNTPLSTFHAGQAGSLPVFGNLGTVDMSGLANLTVTATEFRVGDFGNGANPGATILTLAQSNTINASRSISVGTSGRFTMSGPAGFLVDTLKLGSGTNVLNANNIYLGSNVRNAGDTTSTINLITVLRASGAVVFNTAAGSVNIRASDGTGRANITLGAVSGTATAANRVNTFDVTGHSADLFLGNLMVGAPTNYNPTGGTLDNVFSFNNGTLDVNTVAVASQSGTSATVGLANMTGTVNLGGGTVTVNTGPVTLATVSGTGATGVGTTVTNTGTLNVSGGSVTVLGGGVTLGNNVATNLGSLVATLNVSGGTLTVGGPIGPGAVTVRVTSNLTLSGGTLNMQGNNIGNLTNVTFTNGTLRNLGTLSRDLTQSGGTLLRDAAGTTTISGAYSLTGGTARVLTGGTLATTGGLIASGTGTVLGTGQIDGTVTLGGGGTIQGGDGGATAADELTIPGGLTLSGANTLRAVVADTATGNATADPAASLIDLGAGTLTGSGGLTTVKLSAGPNTLDFGQSYTVTLATFGSHTNLSLANFTIDPNPEGFVYEGAPFLLLNPTTLTITFTPAPEPGAVLLVSGLAAVVAAGWRRSPLAAGGVPAGGVTGGRGSGVRAESASRNPGRDLTKSTPLRFHLHPVRITTTGGRPGGTICCAGGSVSGPRVLRCWSWRRAAWRPPSPRCRRG